VIKGLEIFYSDCANELGRYCAKNSLFWYPKDAWDAHCLCNADFNGFTGEFQAVKMNLAKYQLGKTQVQSPDIFMNGGPGSNWSSEIFITSLTHSPSEEERMQYQKGQATRWLVLSMIDEKHFRGKAANLPMARTELRELCFGCVER
jgi:hypothetical protein